MTHACAFLPLNISAVGSVPSKAPVNPQKPSWNEYPMNLTLSPQQIQTYTQGKGYHSVSFLNYFFFNFQMLLIDVRHKFT